MFESDFYNQSRQNQMDFNSRVNRGVYDVNNYYTRPNQPYGSENYRTPGGGMDPYYRAESYFDSRTPLEKCEVNNSYRDLLPLNPPLPKLNLFEEKKIFDPLNINPKLW